MKTLITRLQVAARGVRPSKRDDVLLLFVEEVNRTGKPPEHDAFFGDLKERMPGVFGVDPCPNCEGQGVLS